MGTELERMKEKIERARADSWMDLRTGWGGGEFRLHSGKHCLILGSTGYVPVPGN